MRLEARGSTSGHRLFARLTIAGSIGGVLFAACVIPNASNPNFHRWMGPLAAVTFLGPIASVLACRYCVDERAAYNDGYNDALKALGTPAPNEVKHVSVPSPISTQIQEKTLPISQPSLSQISAVRPNYSSFGNRSNVDVGPNDNDEFAFLDCSA